MRRALGLCWLVACLGLAGCSVFGKKSPAPAPTPFLGSDPAREAPDRGPAGTRTSAGAEDSGLIAGQVLDKFTNRPIAANIEVVDVTEPKGLARLDKETRDGFFVIQGLKPGRHYRLIARTKGGERLMSGTVLTTPPNPRVSIYVSEDFTTPETPPPPGPPAVPGKAKDKEKEKEGDKASASPAASLERPIKAGPDQGVAPARVAPEPKADPTLLGKGKVEDGFLRAPTVDMPGPPGRDGPADDRKPRRYTPPPPPIAGEGPPSRAPSAVPPATAAPRPAPVPASSLPPQATPVPSCARIGNTIDNFALYDLDGEAWELRKHRTKPLVLLNFWHSTCPPCVTALPFVNGLHERYGNFGLQVLGVAYEKGTPYEREMVVRGVRSRYGLKYTMLLGGHGKDPSKDPCPVGRHMVMTGYPTLVLLDRRGTIVWQGAGFNEGTAADLELMIRKHLGVR